MKTEEFFWFKHFKTKGIGPKKLLNLAKTLPSQKEESFYLQDEEVERIYQEFKKLKENQIQIIHPGHRDYPPEFIKYAEQFSISPVLFAKGRTSLLCAPSVAIVGSRNASEKGLYAARKIAAALANHGLNVISGYAKGIDSAAHIGALEANGTTTIVLSHGILGLTIKRDFKKFNWKHDILAISQFHPEEKWTARNAMIRNKLICALSQVVIVIESGPRINLEGKMSGTFDTGITAIKMKKPLFVITPKFFGKQVDGNKILIQKGGLEFDPANDSDINKIVDKVNKVMKHDNNTNHQLSLFDST